MEVTGSESANGLVLLTKLNALSDCCPRLSRFILSLKRQLEKWLCDQAKQTYFVANIRQDQHAAVANLDIQLQAEFYKGRCQVLSQPVVWSSEQTCRDKWLAIMITKLKNIPPNGEGRG